MKKAGIWLDSKEAWIYKLHGQGEEFVQIFSQVEDTKAGGGYGGASPYGPQMAAPDDKILNRRKHQFKQFFDEIREKIEGSNEILIEGPAEAKLGLHRFIEEVASMKNAHLEIRSADKRTDNQFRASILCRYYFHLFALPK